MNRAMIGFALKTRNLASILAVGAVLAGCVSVIPEAGPAPKTYRLTLGHSPAPSASPGEPSAVVIVHRPSAPSALSTDRIAVILDGGNVASVADARWAEPAPALAGDAIVDALEAFGLMPVRPSDGVRADLSLRLDLLAFEADYQRPELGPELGAELGSGLRSEASGRGGRRGDGPLIHVGVRARLVDDGTRTLIGAQRFEALVPAQSDQLPAIVDAFETASGSVVTAIGAWVAEQVASAD